MERSDSDESIPEDFDTRLTIQNKNCLLEAVSANLIFEIDKSAVHRIGTLYNERVDEGTVPTGIHWSPLLVHVTTLENKYESKLLPYPDDLLDKIVYPEK